jgi:hypothetical protein
MLEPVRMRKGFSVVHGDLGEATRRSLAYPRGWRGLSACDCVLLSGWLHGVSWELEEFHTDVRVGCIPGIDDVGMDEFTRDQISANHPLRIDAVVKLQGKWSIAECKPDAGYQALGQVLCYWHWAPICIPVLLGARAVVVTDRVQEALRPVYERYGVEVIEVPGVLSNR